MKFFLFGLLLTASVAVSFKPPNRPKATPPNVVFILAADLGWADLGCHSNPFNRTPHLNSLVLQGLRFTQAYAAAPAYSPARAAILTGKHPARLHLTNFPVGERVDSASRLTPASWTKFLPSSEVTMAEWLKTQGYATGMVGKWHLGGADSLAPWGQGLDYTRVDRYVIFEDNYLTEFCDDGTHYLTDKLTDYAVNFLEKKWGDFLALPALQLKNRTVGEHKPHAQSDRQSEGTPRPARRLATDCQRQFARA